MFDFKFILKQYQYIIQKNKIWLCSNVLEQKYNRNEQKIKYRSN